MEYKMYTKKEVGKHHIKFLFLYAVVAGALVAGTHFLDQQINPFLFWAVFSGIVGIVLFAVVYLRFITSLTCVENSFIFDKDNVAYYRAPLYVSPRKLRKIGARIVRHSLDPFGISRTLTVAMWNGAFLRIRVQARVGADEANLREYASLFALDLRTPYITPEKLFSAIVEAFLRTMSKQICEMYERGSSDDNICTILQESINVEAVKCGLALLSFSVTTEEQEFIIE